MLYKHWKKIALALTGFFWASCDNTSSADDNSTPESSSSVDKPKSSSATAGDASSSSVEQPNSSATAANPESSSEASANPAASSAAEATSSSSESVDPNITESSSSFDMPAPLYGVRDSFIVIDPVTPKYGVFIASSSSEVIAPKYGVLNPLCQKTGSTLSCEDGVTCKEETKETVQSPECDGDVCAKYGVVIVKETTYKCDDGKVYNEAEFRAKYDILDGAVDLYGCPSDICGAPEENN